MSGSRPTPDRSATAVAALDALYQAGREGDPLRRALWLEALDQRLRLQLPPSLAAHARLANVDGAKLVYLVDAPIWHARLRLAGPELLDAARSLGLTVSDFVVKTAKHSLATAVTGPQQAPVSISPAAAQALNAALASLRDPPHSAPVDEGE